MKFSKVRFLLSFLSKTLGHSGKIMMLNFVGHLRNFYAAQLRFEVSFQFMPKHCGFRVEVRFHGLSFLCGHSEKSQHLEKKTQAVLGICILPANFGQIRKD